MREQNWIYRVTKGWQIKKGKRWCVNAGTSTTKPPPPHSNIYRKKDKTAPNKTKFFEYSKVSVDVWLLSCTYSINSFSVFVVVVNHNLSQFLRYNLAKLTINPITQLLKSCGGALNDLTSTPANANANSSTNNKNDDRISANSKHETFILHYAHSQHSTFKKTKKNNLTFDKMQPLQYLNTKSSLFLRKHPSKKFIEIILENTIHRILLSPN